MHCKMKFDWMLTSNSLAETKAGLVGDTLDRAAHLYRIFTSWLVLIPISIGEYWSFRYSLFAKIDHTSHALSWPQQSK